MLHRDFGMRSACWPPGACSGPLPRRGPQDGGRIGALRAARADRQRGRLRQKRRRNIAARRREAAAGADLIVLPEVWPGANRQYTLQDPPIAAMAEVARRHKTYIVSPIYRRDGTAVYNSSVLIDRQGKIAGVYDKVYPVMHEPNGKGGEFAGVKGRSGSDAPVFQADFGRVGMAICFDGQFPEVWQRLEDHRAQSSSSPACTPPGGRWGPTPRCTTTTSSPAATRANARPTT